MSQSDLVLVTPGLSQDLLFRAYRSGCFPWSGRPAHWYCPDPRAIFDLSSIEFSRRLLRKVRQGKFKVTFDQAFEAVIEHCSLHDDSWIDPEIVEHFCEFHRAGFAHSVEAWEGDELVGGLYGVHLRRVFCGESMFSRRSDASKICFFYLVQKLKELGVTLVDAQVLNPHTRSLGAFEVPRTEFLRRLKAGLEGEGEWRVSW